MAAANGSGSAGVGHAEQDEDLIYVNGVDGGSGDYLVGPLSDQQVAAMARGEPLDQALVGELKARYEADPSRGFEALGAGDLDYNDLGDVGWGVVFAESDPRAAEIKRALKPLLDLREGLAIKGAKSRFFVFEGATGYKDGQSKSKWLAKRGVAAGNPDHDKVPYYLLLVGDPTQIPYTFEYQLDVAHAAGRLHFETLEEYATYAASVVEAETGSTTRDRRACFFGVRNRFDRATKLSHDKLVVPAADDFEDYLEDWEVDRLLDKEATRANLIDVLKQPHAPALLFTASHGVGFGNGHPKQREHQGALVCQDWPGPAGSGITSDHYLSASDVPDDANLAGLIAFHFACFGGGTPRYDGFIRNAGRVLVEIAPASFVARLPQRLLGHPSGGALAVVAHVDRAWGYSLVWPGAGDQIGIFNEALERLANRERVGHAVDRFSASWAELSAAITEEIQERFPNMPDRELAGLWTASNDRRSYVILGDPATRIAVAG